MFVPFSLISQKFFTWVRRLVVRKTYKMHLNSYLLTAFLFGFGSLCCLFWCQLLMKVFSALKGSKKFIIICVFFSPSMSV